MHRIFARSLLLLSLLGGAACTAVRTPSPSTSPGAWAYVQDRLCQRSQPGAALSGLMTGTLARRGDDGWELVSIMPLEDEPEKCYLLTFKRRP